MEILRLGGLQKALRRHPETRTWMNKWIQVTSQATWDSLPDIRRDYPTADGVKLKNELVVTIFNVKGNRFRLLTEVRYSMQEVVFLDLLTHAEYDKQKWK